MKAQVGRGITVQLTLQIGGLEIGQDKYQQKFHPVSGRILAYHGPGDEQQLRRAPEEGVAGKIYPGLRSLSLDFVTGNLRLKCALRPKMVEGEMAGDLTALTIPSQLQVALFFEPQALNHKLTGLIWLVSPAGNCPLYGLFPPLVKLDQAEDLFLEINGRRFELFLSAPSHLSDPDKAPVPVLVSQVLTELGQRLLSS